MRFVTIRRGTMWEMCASVSEWHHSCNRCDASAGNNNFSDKYCKAMSRPIGCGSLAKVLGINGYHWKRRQL